MSAIKRRHWTAEEDAVLGTMPDIDVSKALGRTAIAVLRRRSKLHRRVKHNNTVETFWARVQRDHPKKCWLWTAGTDPNGYGNFSLAGTDYKAHRFMWILKHGEIGSSNLYVCHKCDNPACVNPDHLFLGSNSRNQEDALKKGRRRFGGRHHLAKLTPAQAREIIRIIVAEDRPTFAEIAKRYGVSRTAISHIARGETWRQEHGANTLTRAKARAFDCCKKAGKGMRPDRRKR